MTPHRQHSKPLSCSNPHFGQADTAWQWNDEDGEGIPVTVRRNGTMRKIFFESVDRANIRQCAQEVPAHEILRRYDHGRLNLIAPLSELPTLRMDDNRVDATPSAG